MPIVVIVSNKLRIEILRKATKDATHIKYLAFLRQISVFLSIRNPFVFTYLTTVPLSPLVALAPLVAEHSHGQDPTVKMLYNISQRIPETAATKKNTLKNDILSLCQEIESKIKEDIEAINESLEGNTDKRVLDCLNEGLAIVNSYRPKYKVTSVSTPVLAPAPTLSSAK